MRGFIDDVRLVKDVTARLQSQSAFMRGFIDDVARRVSRIACTGSQSAFMRGFIDDSFWIPQGISE